MMLSCAAPIAEMRMSLRAVFGSLGPVGIACTGMSPSSGVTGKSSGPSRISFRRKIPVFNENHLKLQDRRPRDSNHKVMPGFRAALIVVFCLDILGPRVCNVAVDDRQLSVIPQIKPRMMSTEGIDRHQVFQLDPVCLQPGPKFAE